MNAIVLAGGESFRFGKRDKALATLGRKRLIKIMVDTLQQEFETVYVVANNLKKYSFLKNVELVKDIIPGKGPLGGLYTGLVFSNTECNYLTACDMPLITLDYLRFLKSWPAEYDVLVPEYKRYSEPLAGIYSKSCIPAINSQLKERNLKVKSFFPEVKVEVIKEGILEDEIDNLDEIFFNVNYQEDLELLKETKKLNRQAK